MNNPDTPDYHAFYRDFDRSVLDGMLQGSLQDGINVCVECCDRHVPSNKPAVNWERADGSAGSLSFAELQRESARFANLLTRQASGR